MSKNIVGNNIDTTEAMNSLKELLTILEKLDGEPIPAVEPGRSRAGAMASLTRELLRVDHLLNRAKVLVMDEYWYVKQADRTPIGRASK